jgi:hypothetical protein
MRICIHTDLTNLRADMMNFYSISGQVDPGDLMFKRKPNDVTGFRGEKNEVRALKHQDTRLREAPKAPKTQQNPEK